MASADDLLSVTILKESEDQEPGIKLVKKEKEGVFITKISKNGIFSKSEVGVGDKILSINGHRPGKEESIDDFMEHLITAMGKVTVVVKKAGKNPTRSARSKSPTPARTRIKKEVALNDDGTISHTNFQGGVQDDDDEHPQFCIKAEKEHEGQKGGVSFLKKATDKLFVSGIAADSIFRDTQLDLGDRICSVNDTNFMSYADEAFAEKLMNKDKHMEVVFYVEKGWDDFIIPDDVNKAVHWDSNPKKGGRPPPEPEPEPSPEVSESEEEPEPAPAPAPKPAPPPKKDDEGVKMWWEEGYE